MKPPPGLRERAEAALRVTRTDIARMPPEQVQRLVHELQVHQVELEMQNEELRRTQANLAQSRDRFNDLYDFAPIGYLTLDDNGAVLEANLTVAKMLGVERAKLVGRKFTRFIARGAQDTFHLHQRAVLAGESKQTCALLFRRADGATFFAQMESTAFADPAAGARHCRSAIIDITERKRAEDGLVRTRMELENRVVERTADLTHAIEMLRASEAQLYSFVQQAPAAIAMFDRKMNYLAASQRWVSDYGRGHPDLVGLNDYDIHPDLPESWKEIHRKGLAGETLSNDEDLWLQADGTKRWLRWAVCPWSDAHGTIGGIMIMVEDVTARKSAEDALRENEAYYRQLVHALSAAVYTCDAQGRITLCNAAAVTLWGREPRIGRDRWCGSHRLFTPDGKRLPLARCPMAITVGQGEPVRGAELIVERPDGSRSHVLAFPNPIHDSSGAVVGAVNMLVDITALKVAENALLTSERKLRTLSRATEQSPASVLITAPSGEIEYANPKFTEVTGYSLQEVLQKNPRLLKSGQQPPEFYREMWEAITAGRDWRGEFCNRKKNGELFWEFAVIAPIQDEHGTVTHFVAIKEDITERKRLESEVLRITEEERLHVSADLHDGICQELVAISFLANSLGRDLEERRHPLASKARRIGKAIIAATEHTRQVARGMSPVVTDGSGLMLALRELTRGSVRMQQIVCSFSCPAPVSIENPAAANQLYRIAQEAIRNAQHYGRAKRITVRLSEAHGRICLAVKDDGCGLPPDVLRAPGMGLRVMRYRAGLIGGQLIIQPRRRGGVEVICRLPKPPALP